MNLPVAPLNRLVVTIEKKLYDTVSFESGVTLHIDPTWHPEEFAMLKAKVVSVPLGISTRYDYQGYGCDIQPGDEILVRYDLVFHYHSQPNRDSPVYKNMFLHYNDETEKFDEYWMCDIQKVFGIIKFGMLRMVNGYIYMHQILNNPKSLLILPEAYQSKVFLNKGRVMSAENIKAGQTVLFNPKIVQKYSFDTESFWIIKESHILAIEV